MNCSLSRRPAAVLSFSRTKLVVICDPFCRIVAGEVLSASDGLFDADFDFFRLCILRFRERDSQNTVLVSGGHFARVHSCRQRNAAAEFTAETFRAFGVFA